MFKCPSCDHEGLNSHNFIRHSHIREMTNTAKAGSAKGPTHHKTHTQNSTSSRAISRPPTPLPLLPEADPNIDMDDLQDRDYEPMEVDETPQVVFASATQELIRPVQLQSLQIGIDPWHHCIVCEGCQCGVPRSSLYNHIMQSHGGPSKVPSTLESILDEYQVPIEIHPPTSNYLSKT